MEIRIVCAANKSNVTGEVILGIRHWDEFMQQHRNTLPNRGRNADWVQGFMDNRRCFHTREEAWKIAEAAEQVIRRCGGDQANGGTLYSENLY